MFEWLSNQWALRDKNHTRLPLSTAFLSHLAATKQLASLYTTKLNYHSIFTKWGLSRYMYNVYSRRASYTDVWIFAIESSWFRVTHPCTNILTVEPWHHWKQTYIVSFPDPPSKRKRVLHLLTPQASCCYGFPWKQSLWSVLLGFSKLEGVLSRSVKVCMMSKAIWIAVRKPVQVR